MMTVELQITGDGSSTSFSVLFARLGNYFHTRVARFWGKTGRADIQPKSVTLQGDTAVVQLWSAPLLGESIIVGAELE